MASLAFLFNSHLRTTTLGKLDGLFQNGLDLWQDRDCPPLIVQTAYLASSEWTDRRI